MAQQTTTTNPSPAFPGQKQRLLEEQEGILFRLIHWIRNVIRRIAAFITGRQVYEAPPTPAGNPIEPLHAANEDLLQGDTDTPALDLSHFDAPAPFDPDEVRRLPHAEQPDAVRTILSTLAARAVALSKAHGTGHARIDALAQEIGQRFGVPPARICDLVNGDDAKVYDPDGALKSMISAQKALDITLQSTRTNLIEWAKFATARHLMTDEELRVQLSPFDKNAIGGKDEWLASLVRGASSGAADSVYEGSDASNVLEIRPNVRQTDPRWRAYRAPEMAQNENGAVAVRDTLTAALKSAGPESHSPAGRADGTVPAEEGSADEFAPDPPKLR